MSVAEAHGASFSTAIAARTTRSSSRRDTPRSITVDARAGHDAVLSHGHRGRPDAVGFASNVLDVSSATAGTNPTLPPSSPRVEYQVVFPPACMSPVGQLE